jgi:hypothetical protein
MSKRLALCVGMLLAVVAFGGATAARPGSAATSPSPAPFTLCKSTYALCTTAACTPVAGQKGNLRCPCSVHTGYSAGTKACQPVAHTTAGDAIFSRYYPVKAYAACSNSRPWAWCLDAPCVIDKNDPSKATCTCTATTNQNPYVIVTNAYTKSTCSTGIISSATVSGIQQITKFIKSQNLLPRFSTKVLNSPPPSP